MSLYTNYSSEACFNIVRMIQRDYYPSDVRGYYRNITGSITRDDISLLRNSCYVEALKEDDNRYSKPMVWIGIYIAISSFFCTLAMAADLLHAFRNRKFWFPCKFFSLNAASITVIAVAMKLPVDLSTPMPTVFEQATKVGSMAFMCMMMANLMPSLASMDNNTLVANVIGLSILVVTMIVNIFIQITTGVIPKYSITVSFSIFPEYNLMNFKTLAYIYMVLMLLLLIILISSAITIPTSKQILEFKYQAKSKTTLDDQHIGMSTVEKLRQYVTRYWAMAKSGSPQFVMATNPLSYASGIICVIGLAPYIAMVLSFFLEDHIAAQSGHTAFFQVGDRVTIFGDLDTESDYKWSTVAISFTQFIGVLVGSIAPILRCFTVSNFKSFTKWNGNHLLVFEVEKYWTQRLFEWKESHLPFLSSNRRSRALAHILKNHVLSLCIRFQKAIVVSCKLIGLTRIVLLVFVVGCSYCWKSVKALLFTTPIASSSDDIKEDIGNYVLQIQDEMEFAEKALKGISNSMNRLVKKVEKEQHNNLLELLEKSTGFEGVEKFDTDQVKALLPVEIVNSWSLPVVTLTCIVVALPNIHKDKVESLFKSVGDALSFTFLVEESLNGASEYVYVRRATMNLWHEVEDNYKWLENTLERNAYKGKTTTEILKWFADKAEEIMIEFNASTNGELMEGFPNKLIAANSMYRIAQTILLINYPSISEPVSEEQLFELLSCMIADILCACLTNIPRVITMKCHESVIEKREASVEAAAKLFGRSTEIIKKLEERELPGMDPNKMIFIDEWHLHLKRSIP